MENGPGVKMYFLLNMGIFQPAMLVHQRVDPRFRSSRLRLLIWSSPLTWLSFCFTTYMDLKKSMGKWRLWALKISGLIIEGTIPMVLSFFRMSERMVITWWQYSDEKHVGSHGMKYLSTNAERTIQNSGWKNGYFLQVYIDLCFIHPMRRTIFESLKSWILCLDLFLLTMVNQ